MISWDKDSLFALFFQVIKLQHKRMHTYLEKINIYPGQPPLLMALNFKDGQSQKELAEKLAIKPATITVMIGRMEKAELITRKQDSEDQRISRVYITEKGREICKQSMEIVNSISDECFSNFTEEEKALLRRMFMQMRDNLIEASNKKENV
ncbi:MarR family transcriptional regulator [Clostridium sp. YIM B02515]|uniref:MarR family transcriptional regulator n=1 Tax=Clostridium rhizosphaerae TaxID=2803861 RepID=A0ABS1T9F1_9CLOT|nr:MarR family transcriptional regulator [Clostridium rhizosphaerae]MBL4934643.1 MarR family transcriptional regulator [Clostridium rhizosphaerae]